MKLKIDSHIVKNFLLNFINKGNTPLQVYIRTFILSMIIVIPCLLITINRIYVYYNFKKASILELNNIQINKDKIVELADITTKTIEDVKIIGEQDVNFLSDIGKIAENTDNEIINFKQLPKRIFTIGTNIDVSPVEIDLSGNFETLVNFLEQIKRYDRICIIEKMQMQVNKDNYPYMDASFGLVLYPFINENLDDTEVEFSIDPFRPFYFEEGNVKVRKKTGDMILTGIIKEKQMWAIIEIGGKSYILKNGDSIGENIKITNITNDTVYLIKRDKIIKLKLQNK